MKYSDLLIEWLYELGYRTCFYVGGGNIMHLVDSAHKKMKCVPCVHEVACGIAAEFYNQASSESKAFALVTSGPVLTNIVTAIGGAFLESRELLVIGGQVKSTDLARGYVRQLGIQEINGVEIVKPITNASVLVDQILSKSKITNLVRKGYNAKPGPVFLEFCLDIQGTPISDSKQNELEQTHIHFISAPEISIPADVITTCIHLLMKSRRPIILIGGGYHYVENDELIEKIEMLGVPIMTTWNGADRVGSESTSYFGRPNTWGQRYSNILIQQADLIIALGTRLGLQQTGFNYQEFAKNAKIVQIDIDPNELSKDMRSINLGIPCDARSFLKQLLNTKQDNLSHINVSEWLTFSEFVKNKLPLVEKCNSVEKPYINSFRFFEILSLLSHSTDVIVPCSSGGAFTCFYQTFLNKKGQRIISDKGSASMGYGLAGAIGAAIACPEKRIILVEGDGGFAQNLQEVATAAVNNINLKIFIFANEGYASIRMTQRNYFKGRYYGCDTQSGLGFPDWLLFFKSYNIPVMELTDSFENDLHFQSAFNVIGLHAFIVRIDPEQTYFPKITSHVTESGSMESNPIHLMHPELDTETEKMVFKYLKTFA